MCRPGQLQLWLPSHASAPLSGPCCVPQAVLAGPQVPSCHLPTAVPEAGAHVHAHPAAASVPYCAPPAHPATSTKTVRKASLESAILEALLFRNCFEGTRADQAFADMSSGAYHGLSISTLVMVVVWTFLVTP